MVIAILILGIIGIVLSVILISRKNENKKWSTDNWSGHHIRIVSGTGAGQIREIKKTTKNTITLKKPWDVIPDNDSGFG